MGMVAWLEEWCETWEGVTQFPALPQTFFVTLGCSLQAQFQVWWQYQLRVILYWKQADQFPNLDCNADTNQHSRRTGKECLQMGTLLPSRRSRGNRVVNLLEHQLIICSMKNASWASVEGSPNEVLISELVSPNFKELQKIGTPDISFH